MRVLLPGRAYVIAVAEQALIALDEFGDRLAYVIAAPGFGVYDFGLSGFLIACVVVRAKRVAATESPQERSAALPLRSFVRWRQYSESQNVRIVRRLLLLAYSDLILSFLIAPSTGLVAPSVYFAPIIA